MKNEKGFSLVELIVVIAIMAVLVGIIAPQLIKYIEKVLKMNKSIIVWIIKTLSILDDNLTKTTCFNAKNSEYSYNEDISYPNVAIVWKTIKKIDIADIIYEMIKVFFILGLTIIPLGIAVSKIIGRMLKA